MAEIYLDNAATTRVDEDVAQLMTAIMRSEYGNPSSLHRKGMLAERRLDEARRRVAAALGCAEGELYFTGGGTEANNIAILGGAESLRRRGKTLVAMSYEHASVLEPLRYLERQGWTLRLVDPAPDGTVDADKLLAAVDGDTVLVSCMLVNSEIGAIAPVQELAKALRRKNKLALLHCDAVQAFGKLPFSASKLGVDLMSISSHKIHGPKGCGALYVRKGVKPVPRIYGGGQEKALRPGTENVPAIAGFGLAAEQAAASLSANLAYVQGIYEHFVNCAAKSEGICINSPRDATPYLCNISVPGYKSENLLNDLSGQGIYVSSGSACSGGARSHVLVAMGLAGGLVDSALRASFSRDTTAAEIDAFFEALQTSMATRARSR